jgi:hypothetical protein
LVRGTDSLPLAGSRVVFHRIGTRAQGPIDSMLTTAAGRFAFRVGSPDSDAVYVVSSRHQGIGYFSEPFGRDARVGAGAIVLAVFDTSTAGPPLNVSIRHLVVTEPESAGVRRVLDIVQVSNPGTTTRVGPDSVTPAFLLRLPEGARHFQVGESDVSPSAIRFEDGALAVSAPFPPGEKQVVVSYRLPSGAKRLTVQVDRPTERLQVLVEGGSGARVSGLTIGEPLTLEGRTFASFSAQELAPGASVAVRFGGTAVRGPWWVAVAVAALALVAGSMIGLRRRRAVDETLAVASEPDRLIARLVALDDRYRGREAETPAAEWARYLELRAELKSRLAARLAQEQPARRD